MYTVYTLYNNTLVKYKPNAAVTWKEETEMEYYIDKKKEKTDVITFIPS